MTYPTSHPQSVSIDGSDPKEGGIVGKERDKVVDRWEV